MSGYPAGAGESNGLESLLAQLRSQNKPVHLEPSYSYYNNGGYFGQGSPAQPPQGYQQPSVTSPIPTPPVGNQQPHHPSAVMSPIDSPLQRPAASGGPSNADRTSSLLNLLKFSGASSSSASQPAPIGTPLPASRNTSSAYISPDLHGSVGAGLLEALMGTAQPKATSQQESPQFTPTMQPPQSAFGGATSPPAADTQAYLLSLLSQPKPPQSDITPQLKPTSVLTPPSKASSQEDVDELARALEDSTLEYNMMGTPATEAIPSFVIENSRESAPKNAQGMFSYVNPFEQLAASSPRNRTPKIGTAGPASASSPKIQILKRQEQSESKRKTAERTSSPARSMRKTDLASQVSSSPPAPLPDGRSQVEALIGIGAASDNKESVHAALSEVGDRADKEVQEAISRAENAESQASIDKEMNDLFEAKSNKDFHASAQIVATTIKHELEKEENSGALDSLPTPVAEEVKDIIDEAAHGHIADSWESADAEDSPVKEEENIVKVFNFPMRPWSSITIKETEERPTFRDEAVMDIARLKKEFDQIDRTLVTASNNFIVYGMSKNGGVRIIRQDDGKDARLFTETHDRIFSVVTSSSSAEQKESIIGTGISGTIYWALIKDGEGDHIEESNPEMYGFALPPIQTSDSESPGGVLKTRARKSSGHPDFFAVGRGKYIHVIWPSVITKQSLLKNGKDRMVDTDKYLSKHSLKVNTGKAGKDFTFSEDDSIIVSLDKAGRVKFWDVRNLTSSEIGAHPTRIKQIEVKDPLLTLITTPATEKSWPTSVLFVDKLRPYQRGGALRYLIVGMKQNHTLQLWDLALGKPVQEIHLPHSKESDAVCSVLYHASTGMIVVGHPTRNSIYFLHLSAPKYNLPKSVNQAEYMEKLVAGDSSIAKPESTAVISGMREYSFANKGMLRSLDILQTPNSTSTSSEPSTLFELYAMHSKGVTCLNIKQADLGWTTDNKVIHPVEGLPSGAITIETLKEIAVTLPTPDVAEQTPAATPVRPAPRAAPKEVSAKETPKKAQQGESSASVPKVEKKETITNGGQASTPAPEKAEKKKRRKGTTESAPMDTLPASQSSKAIVLDPMSHARNNEVSKANASQTPQVNAPVPASQESTGALKDIEARVASEVKKLFDKSFDSLYNNINNERRTQAAVAEAKQDAMLRLVSSTLADNVEVTMDRILNKSMQQSVTQSVIPALTKVAEKTVSEQLSQSLQSQLGQSLPKELQRVLPDALGRALQQPQLVKLMSESLAKSVAFRVEEHFALLLQTVVTPAFNNLVAQSTQRVAADIQRQSADQIHAIETARNTDSIKIEQLTQLVTGLTSTISSMASAQTDFQAQFLRLQEQSSSERRALQQQGEGSSTGTARGSISRPPTALTAPVPQKSEAEKQYDAMLESIDAAMTEGQYEIAVIQWLQTQREQVFFKNYFVKFNPDFLRELSPLLLLSLGATISLDFTGDLLPQRISWMETILVAFQGHVNNGTMEPQVRDLIPKIMGIYIQRVEHLFMRISQVSGHEPLLKRLSSLVVAANRVLETALPLGNQGVRHA